MKGINSKMVKILSVFMAVILLLTTINFSAFAEEIVESDVCLGESYIPETDTLPSNDELFEGYALREFESEIYGEITPFGMSAANRLTGTTKRVYDKVKPYLKNIADGKRTSATISVAPKDVLSKLSWTKKELGLSVIAQNGKYTEQAMNKISKALAEEINFDLLADALLADMPYDLYWFDKTRGIYYYYSVTGSDNQATINSLNFAFYVDFNYALNDVFTLNPAKTALAKTAVANAKAVVAAHKNKSDQNKLVAYKDEICKRVTYNYTAAEYGISVIGIDPWQLIYVFDGDPNTNVVCEGYSKAFQYLCDLSTFTSDIICHSVCGWMDNEAHMWNIIEMNGKHYMVDITNCDKGSIGYPDKLFMTSGTPSNNNQTYTFNISKEKIVYTFYDDQKDLICDGFPLLSGDVYIPENIIDFNKQAAKTVELPLGKSMNFGFAVSDLPKWMIDAGYSLSYRTTVSSSSTVFYGANNNTSIDIKNYAKKVGTYSIKQTVNLIYKGVIKNSNSRTITVKIKTPIKITTQPKTTYTKSGANAKVTVKATGDGLKYTWYYKNSGAKKYSKSSITSATYSVKMASASKNRRIYCIITDKYGNKLQTNTVYLRMAATITSQPKTTYTKSGATAKVTVKATGDGLKYTWYYKNAGAKKYSKSSVKSKTYSCKLTKTSKNRRVFCIVTDKYGKKVQSSTVYLRMAATITSQPKTAYAKMGATAKTTVKAAGDGLKYTWYYKNAGAKKYSKSSVKSKTYSCKLTKTSKNRRVYCIVKDKYGKKVQSKTVYIRKK